jgi:CRISPR-associated protein Csb2
MHRTLRARAGSLILLSMSETRPSSSRRSPRPHHPALVQIWRWRIVAANEPIPLNWALAVGDAVMDALMETAWTISGSAKLPICLHGPEDTSGWTHGHAFVLSEDTDADGMIDHITVSASAGLDPRAIRLLAATDRLTLTSGTYAHLMPERMGDLASLPVGVRGPSRSWVSRTAYMPPNGRPKFDARDAARQLNSEIGKRTLAAPLANTPQLMTQIAHGGEPLSPEAFHRDKDNGGVPPSSSAPCFFRLIFAEPVTGPLAFGWSCHRGLGMFLPEG